MSVLAGYAGIDTSGLVDRGAEAVTWTLDRALEAEAQLQARIDVDPGDRAAEINLKAVKKIIRKLRNGEGL